MSKCPNSIEVDPQLEAALAKKGLEIACPTLLEGSSHDLGKERNPSFLSQGSVVLQFPTSLDGSRSSSNLVASSQGKKKSMALRNGQAGTVVVKGRWWTGRYYEDVPGQLSRRRRSIPIGLKGEMTKPEARRKLRAMLEEMGINTAAHLERSLKPVQTFSEHAD